MFMAAANIRSVFVRKYCDLAGGTLMSFAFVVAADFLPRSGQLGT
jgi:hypothetical protein